MLRWHRIAPLDEAQAARRRLWGTPGTSVATGVPVPSAAGRTGLPYLATQPLRPAAAPRHPAAPGLPAHAPPEEARVTMAKYLSREWVDKGRAHVEADKRFLVHTQGLHASILCVVHEQPTHADEVFFIEFDDGHIREIYSGPLSEWKTRGRDVTFEVHGDYNTFVQIQEGHLTQATALMRGRLRLKGSIFKALKYMRALEAVTDILREVPTEY